MSEPYIAHGMIELSATPTHAEWDAQIELLKSGDWVLVPRELTREMRKAGEDEIAARHTNPDCWADPYVDSAWSLMLAATPATSA